MMKSLFKKILFTSFILSNISLLAYAQEGEVTIEYIAHASFRITSPEGTQVIIDPYASDVWIGYEYPKNLKADALVITHPHYDHDGGQYRGLAMPWDTVPETYDQIGTYQLGDMTLTGVRGRHAGDYGKEFGHKNIIWLIEVAGLRITHLGDNGPITDQIKNTVGTVDILMLPADGDQHILKNSEAIEFLNALKPKIQIPMHYCIVELEKSGECPGGLLPLAAPLKTGIKTNDVDGNTTTITKATLPTHSEYWVFQPSLLIARTDNQ
jgi:L-ascorbate metabolism protein UlaG (beta-lactamase superfamily)